MKEHELEINISIPISLVILYLAIVSIVMLGMSSLNNFANISSIPVNALGSTVGFVMFQLLVSFFKNRKSID
ncbi:putative membrane protein [Clostridioides difficile CD160]|nr:putative membrane protein [Clostridioides difficile CD160]